MFFIRRSVQFSFVERRLFAILSPKILFFLQSGSGGVNEGADSLTGGAVAHGEDWLIDARHRWRLTGRSCRADILCGGQYFGDNGEDVVSGGAMVNNARAQCEFA
jgi:hypothetical protein